jgi:gamma-glutamylcyclotransferase (GGCT)/AIG2-like uncharacterized protein YtfP
MASMPARLFVYGTLRRGFPLHEYLEKASPRFIGRGFIRARLYDLGEFPGAVRSDAVDDRVAGEVFELTDPDNQIKQLDEVEEYDLEKPEESLFLRQLVEVDLEDQRTSNAWAYFLPKTPPGAPRIQTGNYAEARPVWK